MSSLAELPELVGFFSYSREDDKDAHGALSDLRHRIQGELRSQLGRPTGTFRIWQDKEAIPSGTLWEAEIKNAVAQSVFFVPIITPTVVRSPYCHFELNAFLTREAALGRSDLVFPILYIDVPALQDSARRQNDPIISVIAKRQYVDWRELRHRDVHSMDVKEAVERFCRHIRDALDRPWISPDERKLQEEAAAQERSEAEQRRQKAEDKRRAEAEARQRTAEGERRQREAEAERNRIAAIEAKARREELRRQGQAEAEQQRAEAERRRTDERRLREVAEAKRSAEEQERRRLRHSQARPPWPPSRPAVVAASLIGLALLGVLGAWLAMTPTNAPVTLAPPAPAPVTPATPAPVTPAPAPTSPTQQATNAPLPAAQERALKPGDTFQECTNCPVMKVVPAGSFTIGAPASEYGQPVAGQPDYEGPQHPVTIARQFAVGQFEVTFDEWNACVADGDCDDYKPSDQGWGRGRRPAINVSWDDANAYVAWLAKKTGKPYRLLSEAEYEYATRAGTTTAYPWGNAIDKNNANCRDCGSQWDGKETAPVGSFAANGFGLFDMVGNVFEWTGDCQHDTYNGAPDDGSTWNSGVCSVRIVRGCSWSAHLWLCRSAYRTWDPAVSRGNRLGFRVGRTLIAP